MKKKGFTLIELLAVIIVLGIILLVAIPSVTTYLQGSRNSTYISSLANYVKAARSLVDTDKVSLNDKNTTYYIPKSCLNLDKDSASPYGEWEDLYVAVTYDGNKHEYYITANDNTKHGIELCKETELEISKIRTDMNSVDHSVLVDNTEKLFVLNNTCSTGRYYTQEDIEDEKHNYGSTFIQGTDFNRKLKKLSIGSSADFSTEDYAIEYIKRSDTEPSESNKQTKNVVSTSDSEYPIYIWFDNGTMWWWSEDKKPSMNSDASDMFYKLNALKGIDKLKYFDTSNVTKMFAMFSGCTSLESLDFTDFDTSNVTDMRSMFANCDSMITLDLSGFNTSKVTTMESMFAGCDELLYLDLNTFDTSSCKSFRYMFSQDQLLETVQLSNWNTSNVENLYGMFCHCNSLERLDSDNWDTSNVVNMGAMFEYDYNLRYVGTKNWRTPNLTDLGGTFWDCYALDNLDVSKWDTSNVTTMHGTFQMCKALSVLDVSNWNTSKVTSMYCLFAGCKNLLLLDVSHFDTSLVTNMHSMFAYCEHLTELDLSSFDTSNVTDMTHMFRMSLDLTTIYASNKFVTTNVGDNKHDFLFEWDNDLVGGEGTTYSSENKSNIEYAKIDGGETSPGYFTAKI